MTRNFFDSSARIGLNVVAAEPSPWIKTSGGLVGSTSSIVAISFIFST